MRARSTETRIALAWRELRRGASGTARRGYLDDRRYVLARATDDGIRTIRRVARLRAIGINRLLESFDDTEREQFADYLERFVDSIDRLVDELATESNRT